MSFNILNIFLIEIKPVWWAYIYSHLIALIIDYWTIIINKFIVLINILIIRFIWALTIIFGNFVFLG